MEAAGLIEKVETPRPLRYAFFFEYLLDLTFLFLQIQLWGYWPTSTADCCFWWCCLFLLRQKRGLFVPASFIRYRVRSPESHLNNYNSFNFYSMDSRIAILGANGTGKSTLLNLVTGVLQPCEGTISKHISLKLAKYSQHSADQLPYDKSPIEYFQALFSEKYPDKDVQAWRAQLGRFGLSGAHQVAPIRQLSDGLRNRWVCLDSANYD